MHPELLSAVCRALGAQQYRNSEPVCFPISGGDINSAVKLVLGRETFFVKSGGVDAEGFAAESDGLEALFDADSGIVIPRPVLHGEYRGHAYLVLEWLDLKPKTNASDAALGAGLARLHGTRQPAFGWHRPNRIGATVQPNPITDRWPSFFVQQRLRHQARLLGDAEVTEGIDAIEAEIDALFDGFTPYPSLLHGDLWGGNYSASDQGPAMFDPACYFGCRETDLAMTELFGGFGPAFYEAYHHNLPLNSGYRRRRGLYQLYHILNHANLFGGAYLPQARERIIRIVNLLREG